MRRRAISARACHGLLAWRRIRRACIVERDPDCAKRLRQEIIQARCRRILPAVTATSMGRTTAGLLSTSRIFTGCCCPRHRQIYFCNTPSAGYRRLCALICDRLHAFSHSVVLLFVDHSSNNLQIFLVLFAVADRTGLKSPSPRLAASGLVESLENLSLRVQGKAARLGTLGHPPRIASWRHAGQSALQRPWPPRPSRYARCGCLRSLNP